MRAAMTSGSHRHPSRIAVATVLAMAFVVGGSATLAATESEPTEPELARPRLAGTWSEIPDAPWGTVFPAAAFTGEEMLVVDLESGRTQSYHPETRTWTQHVTAPKAFDGPSPSVWTGTELLVFDRYKSGRNYAYDPEARRWRKLARSPLKEQWLAEWAGGQVVVRGRTKLEWAVYDVATDTWRSLPAPPGAHRLWSVHWTGDTLLAVAGGHGDRLPHVVALDFDTDTWGKPMKGPADGTPSEPEWIGDRLVFAFGSPRDDANTDSTFDPATGEWVVQDYDCPISTGHALWTGELLVSSHFALDPDTGACQVVPGRDLWDDFTEDNDRSWILNVWTGKELLFWSGANEDTSPPKTDGLAFRLGPIATPAGPDATDGTGELAAAVDDRDPLAPLWAPVHAGDIQVSYTCNGMAFTVAGLADAPAHHEVTPPIGVGALFTPELAQSEWRVATDDGMQALLVRGIDPGNQDGFPLYYVEVARADSGWTGEPGWTWTGEGDCRPNAVFRQPRALGGYWQLDPRRPAPTPGSTKLHLKVWASRDCRSAVKVHGEPVVSMTPEAVLVAVPVRNMVNTDMCAPGPPVRITVRLPEPLGERGIYDMDTLPLRRVDTTASSPGSEVSE